MFPKMILFPLPFKRPFVEFPLSHAKKWDGRKRKVVSGAIWTLFPPSAKRALMSVQSRPLLKSFLSSSPVKVLIAFLFRETRAGFLPRSIPEYGKLEASPPRLFLWNPPLYSRPREMRRAECINTRGRKLLRNGPFLPA